MKLLILLLTAVLSTASRIGDAVSPKTAHRELSGDQISFDDDFWAYNTNTDVTSQTIWTDYSFMPLTCMI